MNSPQAAVNRQPPGGGVPAVVADAGSCEPRMQAYDDLGTRWASTGSVRARIELQQGERWLVAAFVWHGSGPSPFMASVKVMGWSPQHDYLLTLADPQTRCTGNGSVVTVKVPTRLLV